MVKLWMIVLMVCLLGLAGCQRVEVQGSSDPPVAVSTTVEPPSRSQSQSLTPFPTEFVADIIPSATPYAVLSPLACPFLRGRTEEGAFDSVAMRERVRYLVHLPPCYDAYPEVAFPVLYLFHGWPLDEWHWISLGIAQLADDWIQRGIVGPFIMVMPGVGSEGLFVHSSGGSGSFEGMVVDELLPLIERTYRIWQVPEGRAVGGISRGGVWALEIALRYPEMFGILGAHSPALALNRPLPQYDPFLLVDQDAPLTLRIYLDAGDADWARAATIRFRDVLLERDVDVMYQVRSGGHVDELWHEGVPDYLDFYTATWPPSYDALPPWPIDPEQQWLGSP